MPGRSGTHSRLADVDGPARRPHRTAHRGGRAAEWFLRYLDHVVRPLLWLDGTAGIALEAHQQNTLVLLDPDGWPAGGRYRDNQGYYFRESHRAALERRLPGHRRQPATPSSPTPSPTNASPTTSASTTSSVSSAPSAPSASPTNVSCSPPSASSSPVRPGLGSPLPGQLLDGATLRCKANLLTRLHGLDELVGPVDTQSVYVTIANPLHTQRHLTPTELLRGASPCLPPMRAPTPPTPAARRTRDQPRRRREPRTPWTCNCPTDLLSLLAEPADPSPAPRAGRQRLRRRPPGGTGPPRRPGDWAPATTPRSGMFQLLPVRPERDLALITRWMNDPAVAAFWELAGPEHVTAAHLRRQLDGDGRSVPCLGVLGRTPMSYWEIYRADLDPLARHYPARPHDTGIHLLIGGVVDRGRGVGTTLLRAVADLVLDHRPQCPRVVAEPDLRNTPSVSAFLSAGFRFAAEVDLPDKRAALMVRDRALQEPAVRRPRRFRIPPLPPIDRILDPERVLVPTPSVPPMSSHAASSTRSPRPRCWPRPS